MKITQTQTEVIFRSINYKDQFSKVGFHFIANSKTIIPTKKMKIFLSVNFSWEPRI